MNWPENKLQAYIDNFIEESLTFEYKAAQALERTDKKKDQMSKDVSAMANSDGGVIIYGVKEYTDPAKKHLPEKIDPIDRTQFSKEWLEQIVNNIRPHISELVIHPVALNTGPNDVAYVVEIPRSNTAHQATDHRYYKRRNFLSEPMEDYEVRDTMNRAIVPDAAVEFSYNKISIESALHFYGLKVLIKNLGHQVINHFQLQFTFPMLDPHLESQPIKQEHIDFWQVSNSKLNVRYRSNMVLFPEEEREIGQELAIQYRVDSNIYYLISHDYLISRGEPVAVEWKLHADNMPAKTGSVPFIKLQCF